MKIIYELDGKVCVVHPVLSNGLTIEQIAEKDVPSGASYQIVEDSAVPTSREHRNEWKLNGNKVAVDQVKVDAKLAKEAEKSPKKQALLAKLKITEEELSLIKGA